MDLQFLLVCDGGENSGHRHVVVGVNITPENVDIHYFSPIWVQRWSKKDGYLMTLVW
jgi:hypothetical protein